MKTTIIGCTALLLCYACAAQTQAPLTITSVTNGADFKPGFPQRGSLASIFLTGLQGPPGTVVNTQSPLSAGLRDIEVWINFIGAPIVSITFQDSVQQINVQVPWEGERDPLYVEVFQSGTRAVFQGSYTNLGFNVLQAWSVFFVDSTGHAVVRHAGDNSPVTPQSPAHPGEAVIAYGINLGPVTPVPQDGYPGAGNTFNPIALGYIFGSAALGSAVCYGYDQVIVGSSTVSPTYDGLAGGQVGVYALSFQVPAGTPAGDVQMSVQRSLIETPLQPCRPDNSHTSTFTSTSAPALLAVGP